MRINPKLAAAATAACAALTLAACGSSDSTSGGSSTASGDTGAAKAVKVGVVLNGPAQDGGWNTIWGQAITKLKTAMPTAKVTVVPNITPGAPVQRTMDALGRQGYGLVVLTGGYTDADLRKASAAYPKTAFLNLFGSRQQGNVGRFDVAIEEGRYLDGIIAGMKTKTNVLGEVGGFPIPVEARTLNAFAQGVKSVNPKAKIKVLWVNSFYDPAKERQAAQALTDQRADVLVMDSNTPAVASVARARDAFLVGYGISREKDAPQQWLSTFTFDWSPYLIDWTKAVADGTWKTGLFYDGLDAGAIGQSTLGDTVTPAIRAKVDEARKKLASGELKVFAGPIKDNTGKTVVPAGQSLDSPTALTSCCTWLADNVDGKLS